MGSRRQKDNRKNLHTTLEQRYSLAQLHNGDDALFIDAIKKYSPIVNGYIRKMTDSGYEAAETADDLTQQTMINLWRFRNNIKGDFRDLTSYVFVIATNVVFKQGIKDKRTQRGKVLATEHFTQAETPLMDHYDKKELLEMINNFADECLPLKQKTVFKLCYLHDVSYLDAAGILETTDGCIKDSRKRSLDKVKAHFPLGLAS